MNTIAIGILIGIYVSGATVTLATVGTFVTLGGRDTDIWKPFAYAIAWPIMAPMFMWRGR